MVPCVIAIAIRMCINTKSMKAVMSSVMDKISSALFVFIFFLLLFCIYFYIDICLFFCNNNVITFGELVF